MKRILAILLTVCLLIPFVSYSESVVFGTGTVYVRAKGGTLHLRSEPTTKSESIGIVHHGDEIEVLMLGDEWSYIFSYRNGCDGYIKTKYIINFTPAENAFTEMTIQEVSDTSATYPIPGKYYLDLDGDDTMDTVYARLFYDEYGMENFALTFETAYGSTGEATLPFSAYDASIAFAKLDETGRVYVFVTGDVASTDFETYCFYVSEGHMENVHFNAPAPFSYGLGIAGMLEAIDGGYIIINPVLDVLGTRFYRRNMIMKNGVIEAAENSAYVSCYDLSDPEIWEYTSLKTISSVPCFVNGNEFVLEKGTSVIVTWLNYDEREIGFTTESGMNGYFKYSKAMDRDWGIYVGGVYEEDAFEYIPYAG